MDIISDIYKEEKELGKITQKFEIIKWRKKVLVEPNEKSLENVMIQSIRVNTKGLNYDAPGIMQ